jgi:hypothetical protein
MVGEVSAMFASEQVDYQRALRRLATARDLCSTLGEAWKYSYCAAAALKDPKARFLQRSGDPERRFQFRLWWWQTACRSAHPGADAHLHP